MNCINKIMNTMQKINYGFLDKDGKNICDGKNEEYLFNKVYYLMSPEELLNKKVGVCWDQVELERKLFDDNNITNETYFIYIDDKHYLPSHTFLIFYLNEKVYWFEHAWYDEKGIHEYNNLNDLLNDVELKFRLSKKDEVKSNLNVHIFKYLKPNYNISCDEFYNYIYTQKEVFNYKLEKTTDNDLERIKYYKLNSIVKYANDLTNEEMNQIENYISENIPKELKSYKNIITNGNIIGSILTKKTKDGYLLDEIYIEKKYRKKGIGTSIINDFIKDCNEDIYLWVYKDNTNAIKLYKNIGFTINDETNNRYYMKYSKL